MYQLIFGLVCFVYFIPATQGSCQGLRQNFCLRELGPISNTAETYWTQLITGNIFSHLLEGIQANTQVIIFSSAGFFSSYSLARMREVGGIEDGKEQTNFSRETFSLRSPLTFACFWK